MPLTRTAAFTASGLSLMNRLSSMVETLPGVARRALRTTWTPYGGAHAGHQPCTLRRRDRRRRASPGAGVRAGRRVAFRPRHGTALGQVRQRPEIPEGGRVRWPGRPGGDGDDDGPGAARPPGGGAG